MELPECTKARHALGECEIVTRLRRELAAERKLSRTLAEKFADVAEKLARVLAGKEDAETSTATR